MTIATVTVLMPVYGRSVLLAEAWHSLKQQTDPDWQLLIADDGSDDLTASWIAAEPAVDSRTTWRRRSQNLGLFENLNSALNTLSPNCWVLLLCSDDRLLPNAISSIKSLLNTWPSARWVISTHLSIGSASEPKACVSAADHSRFAPKTRMIFAKEFVPLLLKYGSINGNLTGMVFTQQLWRAAGEFHSNWRHAADWEWLIRAVQQAPVLLSRDPIAEVRSHGLQLSNDNRNGGEELREVAAVQRLLLGHPLLQNESQRLNWAAHRMQFQLWNLLKQLFTCHWSGLGSGFADIQRTVGLGRCFLALISYFPQRLLSRFHG